jgi:hypothetical protein
MADAVTVGALNVVEFGSSQVITIQNLTGSGDPDTPMQSLTFSNVALSVNGGPAQNLSNISPLNFDQVTLPGSEAITSFDLTASLGSSLIPVTVNGAAVNISPAISLTYRGAPLSGWRSNFDITVSDPPKSMPEPGIAALLAQGLPVAFLFWRRRGSTA